MTIRLDVSQFPVVVTTLVDAMEEAELSSYLDDFLAKTVAKRQPFVSIVDATQLHAMPSARARRTIADWENRHAEEGSRYNLGVAVISESALIRGAMTALQWLSPPRVPTVFVPTMEKAYAFAGERLATVGVRLPAGRGAA